MKKHFQIVKTELVGTGSLAPGEDVVGEVEFLLLELENPLFHRAFHHEPAANTLLDEKRGRDTKRVNETKMQRLQETKRV